MSNSNGNIQNWDAKTVYGTPGTEVTENGIVYSNKWWTQGDDPLASTQKSSYGPWQVVTSSESGPVTPGPVPATPAPAPATPTAPHEDTGKSFSPYVDMGLTSDHDLLGIARQTGHLDYTLAFVQSSGTNTVGWAGNGTLDNDTFSGNPSLQSQVRTLQSQGGTITISIGGASGTDPAMASTSAAALQSEYQSIIDRYGVTHLDFDIEGRAVTDQASINLRDQALVGLEKANPNLHVSFTLPVEPTGLDGNGSNVLTSAARAGVKLDTVNIMAMDYGPDVDRSGASMGDNAIAAAKATEAQIQAAGLDAKVGITPMIGMNDDTNEVFGLADARKVESFAASTSWVSGIGMWSIARDNGNGAGNQYASATDSSISQAPYEFSSIFSQVSAGSGTASTTRLSAASPRADRSASGQSDNTFSFDLGDTDFMSGQGTGETISDFLTGRDRIEFTQGPAATATNFGATSTASTHFADIQAAAQSLIDGGDAYAFVRNGSNGYLFADETGDKHIDDAAKFTGLTGAHPLQYTDIHAGHMA